MFRTTIKYDNYVNFLSNRRFCLVPGHSNSNNGRFQLFWVFLRTSCTLTLIKNAFFINF